MSIYETNLDQNLANYTVLSPLSFLERSRKTFPDQIAIEYEDYKLTYKQAAKRCNALSELLKSYNVHKNDTVAVMLPNIPEMWECHYGIPMAGAVLNAINTRLDYNTINFILGHGEAKVFIYDSSYSEIVEKAVQNIENKPILLEVVDKVAGLKNSEFAESEKILNYENELNKFSDYSCIVSQKAHSSFSSVLSNTKLQKDSIINLERVNFTIDISPILIQMKVIIKIFATVKTVT